MSAYALAYRGSNVILVDVKRGSLPQMRYRDCLLVFIAIWTIFPSAHASTWMKKPFFAIEIPEDWSEIPGEVLDGMVEAQKGAVEGMAANVSISDSSFLARPMK